MSAAEPPEPRPGASIHVPFPRSQSTPRCHCCGRPDVRIHRHVGPGGHPGHTYAVCPSCDTSTGDLRDRI